MLAGLSSTMRPASPSTIPIGFQGVSFSPKNSTAVSRVTTNQSGGIACTTSFMIGQLRPQITTSATSIA
jgi:hypothetical protein